MDVFHGRRDAAGNESKHASVPNTRFDSEPPEVAFEPVSETDPDASQGVGDRQGLGTRRGAIEISATGSGVWRSVPTEAIGGRLVARIDDAALPAGAYQLRARAFDQAGNETSADRRLDGQPMNVPFHRIDAVMRAGFESARVVRRTVRRHGKRRVIRRRIPELESVARVEPGRHVRARGRPWIATGRAYPALKSTCTRPLPSAPTSRRRAPDRSGRTFRVRSDWWDQSHAAVRLPRFSTSSTGRARSAG